MLVFTYECDGQLVAIGVESPVVYDKVAGSDIGHCVICDWNFVKLRRNWGSEAHITTSL
jgi:hypothetical protein